jgi:phage shock protein E
MLGFLAGSGCGSPGEAGQSSARLGDPARDGAVVIDVRTPGEYARGHVAGSTNVPVDEVVHRIEEVVPDKTTPLVVYCQTGRRSETAAELLEGQGYEVRDLGSFRNAKSVLERR